MSFGPIGIKGYIYERECRHMFAMRRVLVLLNIYTLANIKDSLDRITSYNPIIQILILIRGLMSTVWLYIFLTLSDSLPRE